MSAFRALMTQMDTDTDPGLKAEVVYPAEELGFPDGYIISGTAFSFSASGASLSLDATSATIAGPLYLPSGSIQLAAGSVGTPAINAGQNSSDTNTGIFFPGADQLAFSTGGVQRGTWSSSGLLVNSGNLHVGAVGTSSSSAFLYIGSGVSAGITMERTSATTGKYSFFTRGTGDFGFFDELNARYLLNMLKASGYVQIELGLVLAAGAVFTMDKTITGAGTTGAQTINKQAGSVNFAAAETSLVVTNGLVTANSVIIATVATNDSTLKSVAAVAASGSFTPHANAAATAETRVNFLVIN